MFHLATGTTKVMTKTLTLYLVRHGRTEWNEQGLLQGAKNSPLTPQGIEGAKRTGQKLKQIDFTAVYTSQLQRTIDTAQYILAGKNSPIIPLAQLNEQDFGAWEGQSIAELKQTENQEFYAMQHQPEAYQALNGGETYAQLAQRVEQAIQQITQNHQQGNILIVSHGHTLRLLLALINNIPWQQHRDPELSVSLANTAISIVKYQENENHRGYVIESVNDMDHL